MTEAGAHEAFWATEGLFVIADAIQAKREDAESLVSDKGVGEFVCPLFEMRAACWCAGELHPDGHLPNFVFNPAGFWIIWEKMAGIHQTANRAKPAGMQWKLAVADCIKAVSQWAPQPVGNTVG